MRRARLDAELLKDRRGLDAELAAARLGGHERGDLLGTVAGAPVGPPSSSIATGLSLSPYLRVKFWLPRSRWSASGNGTLSNSALTSRAFAWPRISAPLTRPISSSTSPTGALASRTVSRSFS